MISKLQYNNYETGEFSEEKERSQEEIISLVHNFPWEKQRDYFVVGLTSPSVTIEDNEGNYLKLALYYHEKFIVYYYTANNKLYSHSVIHIEDFTPFISDFISNNVDLNSIKKEDYLSINSLKHFATNEFEYKLSFKRSLIYFFFRTGTGFLSIVLLPLFAKAFASPKPLVPILIVSIACLPYVFLPIFFYLNYCFFSKNVTFITSKQNENFQYKKGETLKIFAKKDINKIEIYSSPLSKNPLAGFALSKILLKNGAELIIPNILINEDTLANKFHQQKIIRINKVILARNKKV